MLYSLEMSYCTRKPVYDSFCLRMMMPVAVLMFVLMLLIMVGMYVFIIIHLYRLPVDWRRSVPLPSLKSYRDPECHI